MKFELADKDIIRKKSLVIWCAVALTLVLDLFSKHLALVHLKAPDAPIELAGGKVIEIIPGFLNLRYAFNTGGAFSMMTDHVALLTVLAGCALAILIFWVYTNSMRNPLVWLAFGMIIGGAIGNLGDRILRGGVVDFIDACWRNYHWPTFNIADSAICVGMGFIVYFSIFLHEEKDVPEINSKDSGKPSTQPQSNQ